MFAPDSTAWGAILALAVFATALALVLFQEGLSRCGAGSGTLLGGAGDFGRIRLGGGLLFRLHAAL